MTIRPGVELGNLTDTGNHRTENEDYYCYAEPANEDAFRVKGRLAVIADGMGGHEGGQEASHLAVERVRDVYLAHSGTDPGEALVAAFGEAQGAIQNYALEHPELDGMGTTCTAAVIKDHQLYFGHVGDSRLYLIREGSISLVTEDHSYVHQLVRRGLITQDEAAVHPERNVLTAALGMSMPVSADFAPQPIPLQPGDVLVLCTDGLHGLVTDQELLTMASNDRPGQACHQLVELAKLRGGFDNITVQILRIL